MFLSARFSRKFFPSGAYTGKICKGGTAMEPEFSHGDVDDLIYQEEWTASER